MHPKEKPTEIMFYRETLIYLATEWTTRKTFFVFTIATSVRYLKVTETINNRLKSFGDLRAIETDHLE